MKGPNNGHEDRYITVWLMKDRTADYTQYRINVHKIKKAAFAVIGVAFALPFLSLLIGLWFASDSPSGGLLASAGELRTCVPLEAPDDATAADRAEAFTHDTVIPLFEIGVRALEAKRPADSAPRRAELAKLNQRVYELELRFRKDSKRSREMVQCMERDLARWMPHGSVGGDDELNAVDSGSGGTGGPGLAEWDEEGGWASGESAPGAGPAQVRSLQDRIAKLDENFASYELSLNDLSSVWGDRNVIFSAFPTYWPVSSGQISSPFGMRIHPIKNEWKLHTGIDIATDAGKDIYAASSGLVTYAKARGGYGNTVIIDHGYGISTLYGHCSSLVVSQGEDVARGQKIAEVGSTGFSTGPHLHFEIRVRDVPVDPMNYLIAFTADPE